MHVCLGRTSMSMTQTGRLQRWRAGLVRRWTKPSMIRLRNRATLIIGIILGVMRHLWLCGCCCCRLPVPSHQCQAAAPPELRHYIICNMCISPNIYLYNLLCCVVFVLPNTVGTSQTLIISTPLSTLSPCAMLLCNIVNHKCSMSGSKYFKNCGACEQVELYQLQSEHGYEDKEHVPIWIALGHRLTQKN